MEWMKIIGDAVQYMEAHIMDEVTVEKIAREVHVSPFYFQKGFAMLCGFTVAEYVRNRRLAIAAADLAATDKTVLEIALSYGYDSRTALQRRSPGSTARPRRRYAPAVRP